jgi:predicted metal-binding membrane protein
VAGLVAILVVAAWYLTWSTSEYQMTFLMMGAPEGAFAFLVFFGLIVVMMVAMMLPAALPMIVTFHGMTRLEAGRPTRPADLRLTSLFVVPYFVVWGAFGVSALVALVALGLMGPMVGLVAFAPAAVLVVAGAYEITRAKEVCLTHCQSPMGFIARHWRSGRGGAVRMGLNHAAYCLGCCWLFMLVLFVAGSMSLVWMAGLSAIIFVEKVSTRQVALVRGIGAILIALGAVFGVQAYLTM